MSPLRVRPLTPERWPDFVDLFSRRGPTTSPRQREGIAATLLEAAVEHARKRSASALEAYPHLVKSDDYMGHVDLFRMCGFRIVRKTKSRAVVQRRLAG